MSRKVEIPQLEDDAWTAGARQIVKMLFFHIAESGKTYTELADKAGLHVQSFKDWRSGKTIPSLDSLLRCFECLGYSLVVARNEDSAFAHSGYFGMEYESERQACKKQRKQPPPRPGSPEWEKQNSVSDAEGNLFKPTPEEIVAEKQALTRPIAERLMACKERESQKVEERRKLFEQKRRKKKSSGKTQL